MRIYLDCIPCFVRQALDAARFATDDEALHERVLREALRAASEMDLRATPPVMGQRLHRLIRQLTGNDDPYQAVKQRFNAVALRMYPRLQHHIAEADEPFAAAARLAIAGNVIDSGISNRLDDATMEDAEAAGLTRIVRVVANGSDAPGTLLADCSEEFRRLFDHADVIVSKGQGNYETLSGADKRIFFVLKAKCPVIARDLGCRVGDLVLKEARPAPPDQPRR